MLLIYEVNSGRSGGGSRGGGSRGGGSRGSSLGSRIKSGLSGLTGKKSGSSGIKSGSSGFGSKVGKAKKRFPGGKLGKIALIGAGAYGAYSLGKVAGKFSSWKSGFGGPAGGWNYQQWNQWREQDGMLCRSDKDCKWIDPNLDCEDYELDFSPTRAWFGGDFAAIIGECDCPDNMQWNNYEVKCEPLNLGLVAFGLGIAGIIAIIVGICCCCACCAFCVFGRKFLGK